jgi:hypothetical protein
MEERVLDFEESIDRDPFMPYELDRKDLLIRRSAITTACAIYNNILKNLKDDKRKETIQSIHDYVNFIETLRRSRINVESVNVDEVDPILNKIMFNGCDTLLRLTKGPLKKEWAVEKYKNKDMATTFINDKRERKGGFNDVSATLERIKINLESSVYKLSFSDIRDGELRSEQYSPLEELGRIVFHDS